MLLPGKCRVSERREILIILFKLKRFLPPVEMTPFEYLAKVLKQILT
jgi:hypothetical protein